MSLLSAIRLAIAAITVVLSNGRNRSEILTAASEGDSDRGKYYDVRVWLAGDKYAWTLPVFVD